MSKITRTKERIRRTGEIFTPLPLVDEILDKLPPEVFTDPTKTCLDPACGEGNFLVRVLDRKLKNGHSPIQAISTIHGVDIMPDNVKECKARLLSEVKHHCRRNNMMDYFNKYKIVLVHLIDHKIVWHDALTYHFNFDGTFPDEKYSNQPKCPC